MSGTALIVRFFHEVWGILIELSPYLLLGFVIAGIFRSIFSPDFIVKRIGRPGLRSSFWGSLFGVPLPLCSCSVVPTGLSLHQQGASRGATVSFLTSTPQTGVDNFTINFSFFGLPMAIYMALTALLSGLTGGAIVDTWVKRDGAAAVEKLPGVKRIQSFKEFVHYSFVEMVASLRNWLMIGIAVAALINMFLPTNLMEVFGGNNMVAYLTILVIALPMYVCSSGSIPIAAALIHKGFPPGAAIVFLLAGPATNAATIGLLWKVLGRRETAVYVGNIIVASLVMALVFDTFFQGYQIPMSFHSADHMSHVSLIAVASAVGVILLVIYTYLERYLVPRHDLTHTHELRLQIDGVHCNNCVGRITSGLRSIDGVKAVDLTLDGSCVVHAAHGTAQSQIESTIQKLGYSIKANPTKDRP